MAEKPNRIQLFYLLIVHVCCSYHRSNFNNLSHREKNRIVANWSAHFLILHIHSVCVCDDNKSSQAALNSVHELNLNKFILEFSIEYLVFFYFFHFVWIPFFSQSLSMVFVWNYCIWKMFVLTHTHKIPNQNSWKSNKKWILLLLFLL